MQRSLPCRATCALLAGLVALLPALRAAAAPAGPRAVVVNPYLALAGAPADLAAKATTLVAGELKSREELKLVPAGGGCFELSLNGDLVYSKLKTGQFPDEEQMIDVVGKRLR